MLPKPDLALRVNTHSGHHLPCRHTACCRGAGAKPGKPAASGKLRGPCTNPACGADEANGQPWYSAANPRVKHLGLQGAICRRCHSFATRTGRLPHFAA